MSLLFHYQFPTLGMTVVWHNQDFAKR